MTSEENRNSEDEIDLIEVGRLIWLKRNFIIKVVLVSILLGLLIGFTSPKEFKSSCTLIPEAMAVDGKLGGSLGGLASLAGIDIGGMAGVNHSINPGLYRSIAESTPFLLQLLKEQYYFESEGEELSIKDYYKYHFKTSLIVKILGLPSKIISFFKSQGSSLPAVASDSSIIALSPDEQSFIEDLRGRIVVTMDYELSVVTVDVVMQDARVAAQIVKFTQNYITGYVEKYAVSKSEEQLKSVRRQFEHRKAEFENAQIDLASFRDRNQFVNTAKARSEEDRLQSKYDLAFGIYNQLAQQVESIRLQINEDKPVFTVLEPVRIPVSRSSPRRGLIILICCGLGFVLSSVWILVTNR
ncbi:MAG: hypothetical protein ACI8Q1_000069 [Parvicella sp.]|jgi:uncharacterized protein involved in exopolysaccharide biosynthesis